MGTYHPNLIQAEHGLSKTCRNVLSWAKIRTFKQLSRYRRITLLKKIPQLTVRHLVSLENQLSARGLGFVPDDTIVVDETLRQRRLFLLWKKGPQPYV